MLWRLQHLVRPRITSPLTMLGHSRGRLQKRARNITGLRNQGDRSTDVSVHTANSASTPTLSNLSSLEVLPKADDLSESHGCVLQLESFPEKLMYISGNAHSVSRKAVSRSCCTGSSGASWMHIERAFQQMLLLGLCASRKAIVLSPRQQ
jgi:hypothetical protein